MSCLLHLRRFAAPLLAVALLFCSSDSFAKEPLPVATGEVILTISGNFDGFQSNRTDGAGIEIDHALLERLPETEFKTETPWTEGQPVWTGVRVSDLLEFVGAKTARFKASALDGYSVVFEKVDVEKYPVILAYKKNDKILSVRELGPLWIMFPFDDFPELVTQTFAAMCVWQVNHIEFL